MRGRALNLNECGVLVDSGSATGVRGTAASVESGTEHHTNDNHIISRDCHLLVMA